MFSRQRKPRGIVEFNVTRNNVLFNIKTKHDGLVEIEELERTTDGLVRVRVLSLSGYERWMHSEIEDIFPEWIHQDRIRWISQDES